MRRGEIRVVNLNPVVGAESANTRPVVIVSKDGTNSAAARLGRGVVTVVPVTSNTEVVYPFQVLLSSADTGLVVDSKAQSEQVRAISIERIGEPIGIVPLDLMIHLDNALRFHLAL